MRAGLLSTTEVIKTISQKFVSTWVVYDELLPKVEQGDQFAKLLCDKHEYPMDFTFLTPQGEFVTRLTSFKDLPAAHLDVAHPARGGRAHVDIFLNTVHKHFGE